MFVNKELTLCRGYCENVEIGEKESLRVYLKELETLKEAMYFKQKLPYTYNDAWILKD